MGSGCATGATEVKVKGNTTATQDQNARWQKKGDTAAPTPSNSAASYVDTEVANRDPNNPLGFSVAPPANSPDLTDKTLKMRKASQMLQLLAGRGRRQAFLGAGYGPSALTTGNEKA